ncbi:MAG: HAD family hydrolase [Candidatus Brocadiia bacterium]
MSELKAVFFDVKGTLWDKDACDRQVLDILLPRYMDRLPEEEHTAVIRRYNAVFLTLPGKQHLRERRSFSRVKRFRALLDSYDLRSDSLAREMARTYDTTRRLIMRQHLRPEAVRVLGALRKMELQTGVIMNGPPAVQRHLLDTLGLLPHLDHCVLAEIEGYRKPDIRLFRRTLELAGAESDHVLYVGDSPLTDILGAARAGIPTVWFQTGHRRLPRDFPTPDFTIRELSELLSVVDV